MKPLGTLPLLSLLLLLATTTAAQQVAFRGKVEDGGGLHVDCTNVVLSGAGVNLNAFVGQQTRITGTWNGSTSSPAVVVAAIEVVAPTFEIGGGGKIGSQATFATIAAPGSPFAMFQSPGSSFAPFRRAGAVLIDTSAMQPIAAGVVGGSGRFEVKVTIPNDPSLAGLTVFGQAAIGLGGGDLLLSNPDCKTLSL